MFGRKIKLFDLLGFEVGIDISWVLLAILVVWSLALGYFPAFHPNLSPSAYWWMAVVGAIGLFFSIIFHEFSHALVARRYGLRISGITLFLFGGVAQMAEEPKDPKTELLMAAAGPIASFVLAGVFYLIHMASVGLGAPVTFSAVVSYLALINAILGGFNLVPAFPLDGGRVLRAALWMRSGNLRQASRTASRTGAALGVGLMVLGGFNVITGNFIGGMWWFLIGLFVRGAAGSSYQQSVAKELLSGVKIAQIMTRDPVAVGPQITLANLVGDYFYRTHHKLYPVVDDGQLIGAVTLREVGQVPEEERGTVPVGQVMQPVGPENTVQAKRDAMEVMAEMQRGRSRLIVVDGRRLVGIVALKDIARYLSMRLELEGDVDAGETHFERPGD